MTKPSSKLPYRRQERVRQDLTSFSTRRISSSSASPEDHRQDDALLAIALDASLASESNTVLTLADASSRTGRVNAFASSLGPNNRRNVRPSPRQEQDQMQFILSVIDDALSILQDDDARGDDIAANNGMFRSQ